MTVKYCCRMNLVIAVKGILRNARQSTAEARDYSGGRDCKLPRFPRLLQTLRSLDQNCSNILSEEPLQFLVRITPTSDYC